MSQRIILYPNQLKTNMTIANYLKHKQIKEKKRLVAKHLSTIGMNYQQSRNAADDLFKQSVTKPRKPVKKTTKKRKTIKK